MKKQKKTKYFRLNRKKENASQCTKHSRISPDITISHYAQIKNETFSGNARYHDMKHSVTKKIYIFTSNSQSTIRNIEFPFETLLQK